MATYAGKYGPQNIFYANGKPAPSVSVTVKTLPALTTATLYTDKSKGTTTANPLQTDSLGNLVFYADPAEYRLDFGSYQMDVVVELHPSEPVGGTGSAHVIQDEGSALTQRSGLNFVGAGVTATDDSANNRTNVTINSSGSAHVIQDEGSALTARSGLNFIGSGVTATDDSANNRTNVTISSGSGSITVQDEGSALTARSFLNFIGAGVTATDDAANNRTNITIVNNSSTSHSYTASTSDIPNPERGFFQYTETHYLSDNSGYSALSSSALATSRSTDKRALVFRYFVMEKFLSLDTLDSAWLNLVAADFNACRTAGVKVIPRFTYSTAGNLTPPYNADPPAARVLSHISQLASVLFAAKDVIFALEAGFIGMWGEWYYTDNFGDLGSANTAQWNNRIAVLNALYDNLDSRIFILVRYNGIKPQWVATQTTRSGNRIGFHNDAFLASTDDWGTYSTFTQMDVPTTQSYTAAQTLIAPTGGESANPNSPHSDWPEASYELANYHYTFLNPLYHATVLSSWGTNINEAKNRLGYRLQLNSSTISNSVSPSGAVSVALTIQNTGYAPAYRGRTAKLVFVGPSVYTVNLPALDVSSIASGTTQTIITAVAGPPSTGTYAMHLILPDSDSGLSSNPDYMIQLANTSMWDNSTGRNNLNHSIIVA